MKNQIYTIISTIGNWIVQLAYLNVLWVLHSIMGLFLLGVFPATVGLFSVIRHWIRNGDTSSIWRVYHHAFKKDFVRSNIIGYIFSIIGLITYVDFRFFHAQDHIIFTTLSYTMLVILIIIALIGLFLYPVFVHYDLKLVSYFKYTLFIVISNIGKILLAIFILAGLTVIFMFVPALMIFYGLSIPAYVIMWFADRMFNKIDYLTTNE